MQFCDEHKPYIFISYSSKDATIVMQDAKELSRRGVNLWIDEELNKSIGEKWNDSVLLAMKNPRCKACFLYVSEHSLISNAVRRELFYTKSDAVRRTHAKKVIPIYPIELQTINDISEWIQVDLVEKYYSHEEFDEENDIFSPHENAIRIGNEFFPDNSVKRFRFYNNHDTAFYDQLCLSISEQIPEVINRTPIPAPAPDYSEERKAAEEILQAARAEAEALLRRAREEAEQQRQRLVAETTSDPEAEQPEAPQTLIQLMHQIVSEHMAGQPCLQIYTREEIPRKVLNGAKSKYLSSVPEDDILLLVDISLFKNGKEGFAITKKELIGHMAFCKIQLNFEKELSIFLDSTETSHLFVLQEDGSVRRVFYNTFTLTIASMYDQLLPLIWQLAGKTCRKPVILPKMPAFTAPTDLPSFLENIFAPLCASSKKATWYHRGQLPPIPSWITLTPSVEGKEPMDSFLAYLQLDTAGKSGLFFCPPFLIGQLDNVVNTWNLETDLCLLSTDNDNYVAVLQTDGQMRQLRVSSQWRLVLPHYQELRHIANIPS